MQNTREQPYADTLAVIMGLDRDELIQRWHAVFNSPPPKRSGLALLRGALAWQCQFAQLPKSQRKDVNRMLVRLQQSTPRPSCRILTPGTRLLREWRGQTHHITVLEKGFEYEGTTYRSLTAITRHITNMSWSGPKFFGLK